VLTILKNGLHSFDWQAFPLTVDLERITGQKHSQAAPCRSLPEHPESLQVIFQHGYDCAAEPAIRGRVRSKVTAAQPADAQSGTNPEPALAGSDQASNVIAGQFLSGARLPMDKAYAVEPY
jgi:hypothetical protein